MTLGAQGKPIVPPGTLCAVDGICLRPRRSSSSAGMCSDGGIGLEMRASQWTFGQRIPAVSRASGRFVRNAIANTIRQLGYSRTSSVFRSPDDHSWY